MTRAGVVDVGTNSVRVLLAEGDLKTLKDLERHLVITRLGEDVDRARRIGAAPLRRTVSAIAGYVELCRARDAEVVRIIATSAVRDAENRKEFTDAVRNATGIEPVLLSGEQEARLAFLGATYDIGASAPYLVLDIGGGSTELVRGETDAERFISLDIGSVRLTERHINSDPPRREELAAVRADADVQLDEAARAIGTEPIGTLIGVAGTITTVAAVALKLPGYDRDAIHHHQLSAGDIARIRDELVSMTTEQRRSLPAMPAGREDVIVAGVLILEQVMERFGCAVCMVSETDILDGTALDLLRSEDLPELPATP